MSAEADRGHPGMLPAIARPSRPADAMIRPLQIALCALPVAPKGTVEQLQNLTQ